MKKKSYMIWNFLWVGKPLSSARSLFISVYILNTCLSIFFIIKIGISFPIEHQPRLLTTGRVCICYFMLFLIWCSFSFYALFHCQNNYKQTMTVATFSKHNNLKSPEIKFQVTIKQQSCDSVFIINHSKEQPKVS